MSTQAVCQLHRSLDYARELVDRTDYRNVSVMVCGELDRTRAARQQEQKLLEAAICRRRQVLADQLEPVMRAMNFTEDAEPFWSNENPRAF